MATKTLYVGNLPYSATESQLNTFFSNYGGNNARIIEGRGFGFVDIDADKMESAIHEQDKADMGGRTLTVNEAKPKAASSGRSGGGSYGGGRY